MPRKPVKEPEAELMGKFEQLDYLRDDTFIGFSADMFGSSLRLPILGAILELTPDVENAGIPADNNKAERALRKLVIKRKKSFGVKTMKGARTMEVLLSVCQSLYNRDRDNFLPALHGLATVSQ